MTRTDRANAVELEEGQVWEWQTDEDEILLYDVEVTIDRLYVADDGTEMVEFTEPVTGMYEETTSTARRDALARSLAGNYTLKEAS